MRKKPEWAADIRKAREMRGLTQPEAAEMCGVPFRTYRNVEAGAISGATAEEVIRKIVPTPNPVIEEMWRRKGRGVTILLQRDRETLGAALSKKGLGHAAPLILDAVAEWLHHEGPPKGDEQMARSIINLTGEQGARDGEAP